MTRQYSQEQPHMLFKNLFKKQRVPILVVKDQEYGFGGRVVTFDMSGIDFTFKRFILLVTDEKLTLTVPEEQPFNLVLISETARMDEDMEFEMEHIIDADTTSLKLELDGALFAALREKLLDSVAVTDFFEIELDGEKPLKNLENYEMVKWKWSKTEKV